MSAVDQRADFVSHVLERLDALEAMGEAPLPLPPPGADPFPLLVEGGDRALINPARLNETWCALRLDDYPLVVPPGQQAPSGWSVPEGANLSGDFEIAGIVGFGTAPFLLEVNVAGAASDAFQNAPIHHRLCTGRGGLPFVLAETVIAIAGTYLRVNVTNLSATANATVRLVAVGRRWVNLGAADQERLRGFQAERPSRPYWAMLDRGAVTIGPGQSSNERAITIPGDSHFAAELLLASSTGPFEVRLRDATSGVELTFDGGVDSRLITGPGGLPARALGAPLVQPRRSLTAVFTDLSGETNTIWFGLHGRRLRLAVAARG